MNAEHENLEAILSELATTRAREHELLLRMAELVDDPAPDLPLHVAQVLARARELFGRDAALFLSTPHWELGHQMPIRVAQDTEGARRVGELLARISYGIPV